VAVFTPYDSATLDATPGQPAGVSLLCLSCHDGTVAIDSFGGATGTSFVSGAALVGTDLANDHPIGFTYDAALNAADPEVNDPTTTVSGLGGNIDVDMLFGLSNDQLECASCHNVHDDLFGNFLIKDNAASALCLTCHDK
jgi:predicted CXXCH cytochrome family protein